MSKPETGRVRRRRIIYIPGYDPNPPRRYRELYRSEGHAQAEISGYGLTLGANRLGDHYGWHVDYHADGTRVESDFQVLVWSDIVRETMDKGLWTAYAQLVRTAWVYIGSGTLSRVVRLRKGPVIAALYPVIFMLLQLIFALLAAYAIGRVLTMVLPWWTGFAGLLVMTPILAWFRRKDGWFLSYYLMHNYAFTAARRGENPPELETRLEVFKDAVAAALKSDVDEVLVVGHSSGVHLAASVLADVFREGRVPDNGPEIGFLSLGHVIPMASFLPEASRLRGDLRYLSEETRLTWLDVTAPGDGCAFALCDPVAVSGVARDGQRWPLVISAAFTQTLSPARWKELRWRFFRLHFQYLCAFDRPGDYDYFAITAGPLTLAKRFQGRAPSKSRITRAVSKYTDVAS